MRLLSTFAAALVHRDPLAYERALARYVDHDQRLVHDGPVRDRFGATVRAVRAALAADPDGADRRLGSDGAVRAALDKALGRLEAGLPRQESAFQAVGLPPELVTLIAAQLGVFRPAYEAFVAGLPRSGTYRPRYLNVGPTGRCNLTCPGCILWGALFAEDGAGRVPPDALEGHFADAERLGFPEGVSFCIGEPTADLRALDRALDRVRASGRLYARSFVTNGRFARSEDAAARVWSRVLAHLGPEKTRRCVFAVSSNRELTAQGVGPEHAVHAVAAFRAVMPNELVVIQIVRDEGYAPQRAELLERFVARGLLSRAELAAAPTRDARGFRLDGGLRLVFSGMQKMPAAGRPGAELVPDPWQGALGLETFADPQAPGLFMGRDDDPAAPHESVARITLGPDGWFYPDYHFLARRARPLARTLPEAIERFERDPILTLLQRRGGWKALVEAWDRVPPDERPLADLRPYLARYPTVSAAAAGVVFGDEDLALRVATAVAAAQGPTDGAPA